MSEITALLDKLALSGATGGVVSAASNSPQQLTALTQTLGERCLLTAKEDEAKAVNALNAFTALANEAIIAAEPCLCACLRQILQACGAKNKDIRTAADAAVSAICSKMSSNAVPSILPVLFESSTIDKDWNQRVTALRTIASFGDHAPEQLGYSLPDIVPVVTSSMTDTKKEVKEAAIAAMTAACEVIGNKDIEHMTPFIIKSFTHPKEVPEIMHNLAGVTFVQSVQSPALAMVVPLLIKGLRASNTATRRQSCVIIDNMSKLVDDPVDAEPFLPLLLPALERAADAMSDPEARGVAENATLQLQRLNKLVEEAKRLGTSAKKADHAQVLDALNGLVGSVVSGNSANAIPLAHIAHLSSSLMNLAKFQNEWDEVAKYLSVVLSNAPKAETTTNELKVACKEMVKITILADEDDDGAEELCNCQFTLAYGTKILLHNTPMRLKRGHKYGLLGGNDSGKTTLMRSIANGSVEGFPDPSIVRTVFVEADIQGELSHLPCVDYIMEDPRLAGLDKNEVLAVMASVGFTEDGKAKPFHAVSTLSGGWRMKLALARAMLQKADILLMDEPTNHLDVINVAWVKNYINSLTDVTAIMVSHNAGFLNDCCTDILQIQRLKLKSYRGNLDAFIEVNPDARSYFSIKESKLTFKFPQPGPIEGVKSKSKALMKMSHCDFTYPGNEKPTLFDISIQVSMKSRVGCVGENGAGKSTMIKVLTGELVAQTGDTWKHPNARVAYVAQHAFHHIEDHLNKTPNEYIRWRYGNGDDKESLVKVSMVLTEEESRLQKEPFEVMVKNEDDGKVQKYMRVVIELTGSRREAKSKEYEYEVKYRGDAEGWLGAKALSRRGWEKACKAVDARIAQRAGQYVRTLSSANVEAHLKDCGLEAEFATHYRMSALSGGQKVKVVLAAAMWNQPHLVILDEPTNYLDRDSLGALAKAVEAFEGGVVIISHNSEFVSQVCNEEWVMDAGHLTTKGDGVAWMDKQDDKISDAPVLTTMTDALGNVSEVKQKKKLSSREKKAYLKAVKAKIANGEELDEDEEEFAQEEKLYE
jgi:elongation factor 3